VPVAPGIAVGCYKWRNLASATAQRRQLLKIKIKALFDASDGIYGYRRLHQELVRGGERSAWGWFQELMRELGLVACQPRPWRTTTVRGEQRTTSDLVGQDFGPGAGANSSGTSPASAPGPAGCIWRR
jgi:putative transposase